MNKRRIPTFTIKEEDEVMQKLQPLNSKACNNNLLWGNAPNQSYSGDYHGYSFKRSNLFGTQFVNSKFDHCNFTGSILHNVRFDSDCTFSSVNFLRSILTNCSFSSQEQLHALNFSSCTLDNVDFRNIILRGSYFNSAKIVNCSFDNTKIMSTSFDNCTIKNSSFNNCNMRNLNLEFSTFIDVKLDGTQLSFYQLPYIIGIFKNPDNLKTVLVGCGKKKTITFAEYISNIHESIVFFTSKKQYLPLANLYYLINKKDIAKNCILIGIDNALLNNDYTLIKYLIKLALILELLNYSEINEIMTNIDKQLSNIKEDKNYSYYLMQSFEIQNDIQNMFNKSILNLKIETKFTNDQFNEASKLCQELDNILIATNTDINYSFNLSHNSPIAIVLTVIGAVSDLIGISSFIYKYIEKKLNKNKKVDNKVKKLLDRNNKLFLSGVNDRISDLKRILDKTDKDKQGEVIDDFRIKLLASIGEMIDINLSLVTTEKN